MLIQDNWADTKTKIIPPIFNETISRHIAVYDADYDKVLRCGTQSYKQNIQLLYFVGGAMNVIAFVAIFVIHTVLL